MAWPELAPLTHELIRQYPARLPGWHRLSFGRVTLTLGFGDAAERLAEISGPVDAWFLDGFAPAKNADMWTSAIFEHMARISATQASVATFTVASAVRSGLEANGFAVRKVTGFGYKREMLIGLFAGGLPPCAAKAATQSASATKKNILVIGAGIAGCSVARALAERGHAITLISRGVADGASGNAAAVLFPQISKRWLPSTAWFFAAEDFSKRWMRQLETQHGVSFISSPGILRLPRHEAEEAALRRINETLGLDPAMVQWLEVGHASETAGIALQTGAAFLPQGSWVNPQAMCHALLQHPRITQRRGVTIETLQQRGDGWVAQAHSGERFETAQLCIANAFEAAQLLPIALPLTTTAGQVSQLGSSDVTTRLACILCHKGYVIPLTSGYLVGATYDREDRSGAVTEANHQKNRAEVETFLPGWITGHIVQGRTSVRTTTPDRLPYAGAIAPGLWVSLGHGSRGMISAPLAAEVIASAISAEMPPVGPALCRVVDPQRMLKSR